MSEVLVTAASIVSPLGDTVHSFSENLRNGISGISSLKGHRVPESFPITEGGLLHRSEDNSIIETPNCLEKEMRYLIQDLIQQALPDLEGIQPLDAVYAGCADVGTNWTDSIAIYSQNSESRQSAVNRVDSLSVLDEVLEDHAVPTSQNFRRIGLNNTCITGNSLIGQAFQRISTRQIQRALILSVEQFIKPTTILPYHLLGALSGSADDLQIHSCPFSKQRNGFVKGEGAALLLLESRQSAEKRGARSFGSIKGYWQTNDGHHLTEGHPEQRGAVEAILGAIKSAGLSIEDIDYINAHGSSTPLNDISETRAIKKAFGPQAYRVPISSIKSQTGHSHIACGTIEAIACLAMLNNGFISPTINFKEADPDCDLDYVPNKQRDAELNAVLSNSFGFGGHNACIIIGRPDLPNPF